MSFFRGSTLVVALAGLGSSAHAFAVDVESNDVYYRASGAMTSVYYGGVASADFGPLAVPDAVQLVVPVGLREFSAYYTSDGYANFLNLTLTGTENDLSDSGTWVCASGTGAYAKLAGSGTYAWTGNKGYGPSTFSISGTLAPVPEPASLAALGLGALGAVRRKAGRRERGAA